MASGRTMIGISFVHIHPNISVVLLFGSSRYWLESSICDKLKHQKWCLEVLFFLECWRGLPRAGWRTLVTILYLFCDLFTPLPLYSQRKKKCFQAPFLVLQTVTNRGLYSVPKRTKWYLEAPWQAYWDGPQYAYHGPFGYHLVLPGTE